MVALKSERRIFLWRMSPHASPTEAPVDVKFEQIFDILKIAFDKKEAFAHVDALVQRYMDALVDKATETNPDFTYEKPVKKGKTTVIETRPYKLRLSINKVPSDDLVADVKKGRLSAIKLIRTKPNTSAAATKVAAALKKV